MRNNSSSQSYYQRMNATRSSVPSKSLLYAAIATAALSSTYSQAQAPSGVRILEEVVVTATRREEGMQSIPASISAVTSEDLNDRGITNFQGVTQAVPGLDLVQPGSSLSVGLYMRGVGTSGGSGADPSVGVLVDGVYQLRPGAVFNELLDLERIEILRGPQGTLFGKNTTAGVIRIITADPDTYDFSGHVQGVVGNLDNTELRGVINIPVVEGILAARVSGYTADREGYTQNVFIGEDTRNVDREGIRAKLLWTPTETFEAKFTAENTKQHTNMDYALVEYGDKYAPYADILPPVSPGKAQQDYGFTAEEIERYALNFSWDLPGHILTTVSAYERVDVSLRQDQDRTALSTELGPSALVLVDNANTTKSMAHEIQLASDNDSAMSYVVGAYYQTEELNSNTVLLFNSFTLPRPPSVRDVDSKAVFGNVTYEFSDQWSASLGARYTEDEKDGENFSFSGVTSFDELTYSAKLMYHLDADTMFYLAHDKGFKSGGVNGAWSRCGAGGACVPPELATWDPEISYNYEIGIKSELFDNRLRLNSTLFYQTYEDFQARIELLAEAQTVTINAAEVESMGLETEFLAVINDNFTLSGALSYVQSEYEDFENAPCAVPDYPGCVGGNQDLSGRTLDHAPKLTYNLTGEYRDFLSSSNGVEWFVRSDLIFKDEQNLFDRLPVETEIDSYYLMNARIGLEAEGEWKLALWGNNLFDEDYLVDTQLRDVGLSQIPGLGRTYGVTADWYF